MSKNDFSYANLNNLEALEQLYGKFLLNPESVDLSWRHFFEGMAFAQSRISTCPESQLRQKQDSSDLRIYLLIDAYRKFGHLMAAFNPVETTKTKEVPELDIECFGLKKEELDGFFPVFGFANLEAVKNLYCASVGVECMGFQNPELELWIQKQIEPQFPYPLDNKEKIQLLHHLNKAELFESFLHTKYVGQKRFSLEGAETLIPMLSLLIEKGSEGSLQEVVIGMPHRGRLNVLANILNKSYAHIFHEFEGVYSPELNQGTGDVKYHKGFIGSLSMPSGKEIAITLVANPSHLESVDPVVEGIVRAKQDLQRSQREKILPILIHGDAAVAGQGVVYETLQFSALNGYTTGGTIHIVVNNQIGFTALPKETRSTTYCTSIAKAFGAPVFHVNAEDPQMCVRVAKLCVEIRQKFHCDVFIDLNCYRKYGHNEGDEPMFTQPLEYTLIRGKRSIREIFCDQLIKEGVLNAEKALEMQEEFKTQLQKILDEIKTPLANRLEGHETPVAKEVVVSKMNTSVDAKTLLSLAKSFCATPNDLRVHPKIKRLLEDRLAMVNADPLENKIDWGMGECLAFATLLDEKIHIRLSGQDVRRGTFSHRHAVFVDQEREQKYFPLSHLSQSQAPCDIYNSSLSEFAVLGFEFGYSVAYPKSLVIWEAQFGDFANGAQIIIDQYIAASEQKWSLKCNLTLLLPHGYEGQGPEHSSARIERFLQLAGHENMRIANCSTPSQLFHLLRSQAYLPVQKPLIIFTPKVLLRHPSCVSSINDLSQGCFMEVIDDVTLLKPIKKLIFCSGKVYYDLLEERKKRQCEEIALVRIEQLYPFPREQIMKILEKHTKSHGIYWVQEEHSNMGPWQYIRSFFNDALGVSIRYIGRDLSASPATGSYTLHKKQLEQVLQMAFQEEKL